MATISLIGFVKRILKEGSEGEPCQYVIEAQNPETYEAEELTLETPASLSIVEGDALRLNLSENFHQEKGWVNHLSLSKMPEIYRHSVGEVPHVQRRLIDVSDDDDPVMFQELAPWMEIAEEWPVKTSATMELVIYEGVRATEDKAVLSYAQWLGDGLSELPIWLVDPDDIRWEMPLDRQKEHNFQREKMREVEAELAARLPSYNNWAEAVFDDELTGFGGSEMRHKGEFEPENGLYGNGRLVFPQTKYETILLSGWYDLAGVTAASFPLRLEKLTGDVVVADQIFTMAHELGHGLDWGMDAGDPVRDECFADAFGLIATANKLQSSAALEPIVAARNVNFLFGQNQHATGPFVRQVLRHVRTLEENGKLGTLSAANILQEAKDLIKELPYDQASMLSVLQERDAFYQEMGCKPDEEFLDTDRYSGQTSDEVDFDGLEEDDESFYWMDHQNKIVKGLKRAVRRGNLPPSMLDYVQPALDYLDEFCHSNADFESKAARQKYVKDFGKNLNRLIAETGHDLNHMDGFLFEVEGTWFAKASDLPRNLTKLQNLMQQSLQKNYSEKIREKRVEGLNEPISNTSATPISLRRQPSIKIEPLLDAPLSVRLDRLMTLTRRETEALKKQNYKAARRCAQASILLAESCYYDSQAPAALGEQATFWGFVLSDRLEMRFDYEQLSFLQDHISEKYTENLQSWLERGAAARRPSVTVQDQQKVHKMPGYRMQRRTLAP